MAVLQSAEQKLVDVFKDLPPLSKGAKESLANAWPWIALTFGVLQLLAAYWLWKLASIVNVLDTYSNTLVRTYGGQDINLSGTDKTIIYLGLAILVVDAVILLLAFSPLKNRARRGWDLLFLASMINLAYSVISLFIDGRGFGSFLVGLLGSAIGFYLLFQVRELYKGSPHHKS